MNPGSTIKACTEMAEPPKASRSVEWIAERSTKRANTTVTAV
ncbi:MAG: hypothetical protein ABIQ18_09560 [Umezawaea sp.]